MDPRLLRYYNEELRHLREMGAEFAASFPKIAARLGIEGLEVTDPYVERLLEGFAFLAGRVQLRLDAEFPKFTQRLLEIVYPHFLAPTPSILIARMTPDLGDPGLAQGALVPAGSVLMSRAGKASTTACEFRSAHAVTLWPIEISHAEYFTHAADVPVAAMPEWRKARAGLRIRLRVAPGLDFARLALQDLRLHLSGVDDIAYRLHELLAGHAMGVLVQPAVRGSGKWEALDADAVEPIGFDDDQALLPATLQGFAGYRLMQEYFAFPQRFMFFDVRGVGEALRKIGGSEAEVVILFARADTALLQAVDANCVSLHCVPAINLLERRCDRIHVETDQHEFHVVPDRTRPLDFEVYSVLDVQGHGAGTDAARRFAPLYSAFQSELRGPPAFYTMQRELRLLSTVQQRDGPRSSYLGSEVYLSLVDSAEAPYSTDLRQVSVKAMCTNRDLPILMPTGQSGGDLTLAVAAPVRDIAVIKGPSRPLSALRETNLSWKLINQLSLNHLSLLDSDATHGTTALRQIMRLYVPGGDAAALRQVDGIRSARMSPVVRRLPMPGPITFGRGVAIDLEVDDLAFEGGSAFLLGCVLERFLSRHVSINGFTQLKLRSPDRGEILAGVPRCGARPML